MTERAQSMRLILSLQPRPLNVNSANALVRTRGFEICLYHYYDIAINGKMVLVTDGMALCKN